jgi:ribosomal protein S24E
MKLNITNKRTNPAMQRDELTASVDYAGGPTPSAATVRAELAKALSVTEDRIEIAKLLSSAGKPAGTVWLNVWQTAELVPKPKVKKTEEKK